MHRGFIAGGAFNWGDWFWIAPDTLSTYNRPPAFWEPLWGLGHTNAQINLGPVYWLMGFLGHLGMSAPMAARLVVFWPMAIIPFVSMFLMLRRFDLRPGARAGGAFVFGANSYLMTREIQHSFIVMAAACAPFVWSITIDALRSYEQGTATKRSRLADCLKFGLTFGIVLMFDVRVALLTMITAVLLMAGCALTRRSSRASVFGFFVGGMSSTITLHLFWIIPAFLGATGAFSGKLPSEPFENFYTLSHALALSEPFYSGSQPVWFSQYAVMWPLFALPLLAFGGPIVARGRKRFEITAFTITAILGICLVKGQNDPFGGVYNWAFLRVPGLRLFRDASKFAVWIAAGYSVLVAICINRTVNWWRQRQDSVAPFADAQRQLRLWRDSRAQLQDFWLQYRTRVLAILVVCSFVVACAYGSRAAIANTMGGTFTSLSVPSDFAQFSDTLQRDDEFGRVLWLPATARWADISNNHAAVTPSDISPLAATTDPGWSLPQAETLMRQIVTLPHFVEALRLAGVKYVALDNDLSSEAWNNTELPQQTRQSFAALAVQAMSTNPDFVPVANESGLTVYRLATPGSLFTTSRSGSVASAAPSKRVGESKFTVDLGHATGTPQTVRMSSNWDTNWLADIQVQQVGGNWTSIHAEHRPLADGTNGWTFTAPAGSNIRANVHFSPQALAPLACVLSALALCLTIIGLVLLRKRKSIAHPRNEQRQVVLDLNTETERQLTSA